MSNLLLIFLGGGIGSVARFLVMQFVSRQTPGSNFPWHTFCVNIVGAFIMGVLLEILGLRVSIPAPARYFLVTGIIGGFTTFSAFSLDVALLMERGDYLNSGLYAVASVAGTVAILFVGSALVRWAS